MKKIFIKPFLFSAAFIVMALIVHSCGDTATPPQPTNEEELITTLKVELKDSVSGQFLNYFFRDPDGEGANAPTQWDTIKMDSARTYIASLKFLNESNPNAVLNITAEIKVEQNNHIICYAVNGANVIVNITDSDGTYPLGLDSKWLTGKSSSGKITITLKHQPGIKNGGCNPGDTDVEVEFPMTVNGK